MLAAETQLVQALLSAVSGKESRKCHASSPDHGSLLWWRLIRSFVFCETGTFSASFGSMGQCRGTLLMCCGMLLCLLMQVLLAPRRHPGVRVPYIRISTTDIGSGQRVGRRQQGFVSGLSG